MAGRCADAGLAVALVERELVGGECSYWGCIPSKTLIRPGDVLAAARRTPGAAEAVTGSLDVEAAFAQRDYMTSDWHDDGQLPWLEGQGDRALPRQSAASRVSGRCWWRAPTARRRRLTARAAVVLATGTGAAIPPVDGLRDVEPWDNRSATSAKQLPRRLLVLGGGAIGCEMAQAFRRLGTEEVTVIEGGERLLGREEPFAGDEVREAFEAEGITVITGVALSSARARRRRAVRCSPRWPTGASVEGDEILVAVGRRPATANLGLDAGGPGARTLRRGRRAAPGGRACQAGGCTPWATATGGPC